MHRQKKTIFISGSSTGIGYYLAQKCRSLGHDIIINGTNFNRLKKHH